MRPALAACLALACLQGCAGTAGLGAEPPYRFRQALIDPEGNAPAPQATAHATRPATRDTARCRALVGRALAGELALVRACTGVALSAIPPAGLARREAALLDLVLFQGAPVRLGVVVGRAGTRTEFVFLRGGRVQLGVLSTSQPHRRRLPGAAR
ncbi:MAG: hypothetical protein ACOY3Y_02645, partial [Acidobacteriota bacterium]